MRSRFRFSFQNSHRCNMSRDPRATTKSLYINRNRVLAKMGFASYQDYLKSDLWRSIREKVLSTSGGCKKCGKQAECVHHLDYSKQTLNGERLNKLVKLCNKCHYSIEFDGSEKLLATNEIASRTTKLLKSKSTKYWPTCRCCRNQRKQLGRNDICLECYKKHKKNVHRIAEQKSG